MPWLRPSPRVRQRVDACFRITPSKDGRRARIDWSDGHRALEGDIQRMAYYACAHLIGMVNAAGAARSYRRSMLFLGVLFFLNAIATLAMLANIIW